MSVTEKEEDEPEYCEAHGLPMPCRQCRINRRNEQALDNQE